MQIINTKDEKERVNTWKANTSYNPQADSHMVSYLYAREHYYKNTPDEKIGLEVDNFIEIQKQLIIDRILSKYNLTRFKNE